jgi:hypothetical protein
MMILVHFALCHPGNISLGIHLNNWVSRGPDTGGFGNTHRSALPRL